MAEETRMYACEVGFESSLADGSVTLNGAAFFYDREDLQVFEVDETGAPAFLDAPGTAIFGAEAELQWVPADTWYISGGIGCLHGEITDVDGLTKVETGSVLQNAPKWTLNGLV